MVAQNTSDMIEQYLKALLEEAAEIEIQRAELANKFDVVPSQINYVIKTRFNVTKGFDVESKRGGGGYIKIVKFHYSAKHDLLNDIYARISSQLTIDEAQDVLQFLFDEKILTKREGNLLLSVLSKTVISDSVRSGFMKEILQGLDRENEL